MKEISKEYASALFMLAQEENLSKEFSDELALVSSVFQTNPEYIDFLTSPNIPINERAAAIDNAFGGSLNEYIVSFLKILCEKHHIRDYFECVLEYNELYHAANGISTAKVISAVRLNNEEKAALKKKLEELCGHYVIMEYSINKAIIGGLIVYIDGKILDGSLRRRLHDIKEVMHQ